MGRHSSKLGSQTTLVVFYMKLSNSEEIWSWTTPTLRYICAVTNILTSTLVFILTHILTCTVTFFLTYTLTYSLNYSNISYSMACYLTRTGWAHRLWRAAKPGRWKPGKISDKHGEIWPMENEPFLITHLKISLKLFEQFFPWNVVISHCQQQDFLFQPLPCHDTMAPHMAPKKSAWMLRILKVGKCGGKTMVQSIIVTAIHTEGSNLVCPILPNVNPDCKNLVISTTIITNTGTFGSSQLLVSPLKSGCHQSQWGYITNKKSSNDHEDDFARRTGALPKLVFCARLNIYIYIYIFKQWTWGDTQHWI